MHPVGYKKQRVVAALEELGVKVQDGRVRKSDLEKILHEEVVATTMSQALGTSLLEHTTWCQGNPKVADLLRRNFDLRESLRRDILHLRQNAQALLQQSDKLTVAEFPAEPDSAEGKRGFSRVQQEVSARCDEILKLLKLRLG